MRPVQGSDPRVYRRYNVRVPIELERAGRVEALETEDVSQGGCRVVVPSRWGKGERVQVRMCAPRLPLEASGAATVAWARGEVPCRVGLRFSEELASRMAPYLRALLGPVPLLTKEDGQ